MLVLINSMICVVRTLEIDFNKQTIHVGVNKQDSVCLTKTALV